MNTDPSAARVHLRFGHVGARFTATLLLAVSLASAWTTPERVDRRPAGYQTWLTAVAATQIGVPHVVWTEYPDGTYYDKVMYARRGGDTWTVPVNVGRDSGDLRRADIAVDTSGIPLVAWSEQGTGRLRYTRLLGDTWALPKLVTSAFTFGPKMVVDSRNRVYLTYEEPAITQGIWYSYYFVEGDSWATPSLVADESGDLGWHDLTADRSDHLHVVWMDVGTNGIGYSYFDGTAWSPAAQLPDPAPQGQSCDPRVACDSLCRPHVVWEERWGGYFAYYTQWTGDSWSTPERMSSARGFKPKVCLDRDDRVHAVWEGDSAILHAFRTDSGWTLPETVYRSAFAPQEVEYNAGWMHVAFWDASDRVFYTRGEATGVGEGRVGVTADRWCRATVRPGSVEVHFTTSAAGPAAVALYDTAGRERASLSLGPLRPGEHEARLATGSLPAGTYFCEVSHDGRTDTVKVVLTR